MLRILFLLVFAVAASAQDFVRDIRPLFQKRCVACHGPAVQSNGLRLDHGEAALKGGYSGVAIVKGNAAASRLVQRIESEKAGEQMPPAGPRLTEAEIRMVRAWIDKGAEWPATAGAPAGAPRSRHWSFQPVRKPAPPMVNTANWVRNEIDRFILARLEKESLTPSPEADRITLLRRVSLDLTGLPPTPAEVAEFLADTAPGAYERQVDRLLRSQHYGEKWARHWLDLAHYADSDGYEKDLVRPYAWRYRNWVIDAFNRDLPFDRFTIEQLAGDLLPNATVDQRVATGFLRNTLTNREAGVDREEARFEQLVNRTNTAGTVWLGLAVGCAQCHNHKYDPITQQDYYEMLAFFDRSDERDIDAPLPGELGPYLAALPEYESKRAALLKEYEVAPLQQYWESRLIEAIDKPGTSPEWDFALTSMRAMFDRATSVLKTPPGKREPRDERRLTDYFVHRTGLAPGMDKDKMERLKELRKKLDALDNSLPPFTQAYVMVEDPAAPPTQIRIRGEWKNKGVAVEPGVIDAVAPFRASGRPTRLDFARWLVSRDNPLTARVAVNRVWHEMFGRGIVKTTEDFGVKGDKPTHPELLDWLASEFMDRGWSMKQLVRLIATSATYRQSSRQRPELSSKDPENTLLARQSRVRLPAELIRDAALASSGLLSTEIGGRSVKPPQPAGVAELGYGRQKWEVTPGKDKYRRGLYVHFQRTTPFPMLMNFDAPDGAVSCTRRGRSNTPLQALNLLNDEVFFEAATALAWRVEREGGATLADRLDYAFRLCLSRPPSERERERLAAFHDQQARIFEKEGGAHPAWVGVSRVLLNLDEFITRE